MKYGLLVTSPKNIGEEIQTLAALRFLPKVDYLIHRERTDEFHADSKVKLIMNHWWMWEPKHFPPSDSIDPLFVSFHLRYPLRNEKFLNKKVIDYLKAHEPIGCRDKGSAEYMSSKGIDAYFSGCLTTTLLPNPSLKGKYISDYILCVSAPDEVVEAIRQRTDKKVICISRHQNVCTSYEQRMKMAKFALFLYHNAYCIVTVGLHVSIPATAFGTPVCVINTDNLDTKKRFEGMESCFNMVKTKDFVADPSLYDVNNPPPNPKDYEKIRDPLVQRCKEFTGYDSERSVFEDSYNPLFDMAELTAYSEQSAYETAFYMRKRNLLKASFERFVLGKSRNDLKASRECDENDHFFFEK